MQLCIFEDSKYANFQPLVYFRPVYALRCGILSLREKIALLLPRASVALHVRAELEELCRQENPSCLVNELADDDTWFINGRVIAGDELSRSIRSHDKRREIVVCQDDTVAAAFLKGSHVSAIARRLGERPIEELLRALPAGESVYPMVRYLWDIIQAGPREIEADFLALSRRRSKAAPSGRTRRGGGKIYPGVHLLGRKDILLGAGAVLKPGVVLDAEQGPIVIGEGAALLPNVVVEGPAFIGERSLVKAGARICHGSSIGRSCKVGGEIEASVIQGYSNKQHDGFLGHSYLGSWVNIGADTNTSDLKNTYGPVKVRLESGQIDTGMQFVGLMMGDHAKTGINVMFDTGTVVGASCNIYGAGLPPKFLPSFCWGGEASFIVYDLEKSLETARRVFARRDVPFTAAYERVFRRVYAASQPSREKAGIR